MEGERILKELLKKRLDGLYADTKNYLGLLTSLVEGRNGYKATGCKSVEEVVTKYGLFCNKLLRCSIEVLKGMKETGKEIEELLRLLTMVTKTLDMVITSEKGKYLKFAPSLDDICRKLLHLTNQLVNKSKFDDALGYLNHCLKYLELSKNNESIRENISAIAAQMGILAWKVAQQLEQSNTSKKYPKGSTEQLNVCSTVLNWRLFSLQFEGKANASINNLVKKAVMAASKFQMDCGATYSDSSSTLMDFHEVVFTQAIDKASEMIEKDHEGAINSLFSLIEFGFHYGRVCLNLRRTEKAHGVFEQLQNFVSHVLSPRLVNTAEGCTVSRFCVCTCSIGKAALNVDAISHHSTTKKSETSKEFIALNKLLDDTKRVLNLLLENRTKAAFPMSTILLALESFKSSLQNAFNASKVNKEGKTSNSDLGFSLPYKTFQSLEPLLLQYAGLLKLHAQSTFRGMSAEKKTNGIKISYSQLKQQLQRITDRRLSLSSFVLSLYQNQLQAGSKEMVVQRQELLSKCLQISQQTSELIHSLMSSDDVSISENDLMWLGSSSFSLGMEAYKRDQFKEGAALMSLGCRSLKDWCCIAGGDLQLASLRLQELLPKYGVLSDCYRRAKCYDDAFDSATTSIVLSLTLMQEPHVCTALVKKNVHAWVRAKHDLVKHTQEDNAMKIRTRTLCTTIAEQDSIVDIKNTQLTSLLEEEFASYEVLANRYDVSVEQATVTKQLIELYSGGENSLELGSVMLEHARALYATGNQSFGDKLPLEYCQEAMCILESLREQTAVKDPSLVTIQDRLGAAYLWQSILQHKDAIRAHSHGGDRLEGNGEVDSSINTDDLDIAGDQQQIISLDQPYILSLHAAVDMWTAVVDQSSKRSADGEISLTALHNPTETTQYLHTAALMYGLLNQPLNQVHALHLCAVIGQAISTQEAMDDALVAYVQAIHTLCYIRDLSHASMLMEYSNEIAGKRDPSPLARIQHMLAKSHYCLLTGEFAEGEDCLNKVLGSELLTQKTRASFVVLARAKAIMSDYLSLPPNVYNYQHDAGSSNPADPLTPLEAAVDSFLSLEGTANSLFGHSISDLYSFTVVDDNGAVAPDSANGDLQLLTLHNLLLSQLQCGMMLAYQGMVRQANRYFTDGLVLARKFLLPYRAVEFIINLSLIKMQRGQMDDAKKSILHAASILAPVLQTKPDEIEDCVSVPPLVNHPETCHCVCCSDPALQTIQIQYFLAVARYFESMSQPKVSIKALEGTETLCSNAVDRTRTSLHEFSSTLKLGMKRDQTVNLEDAATGKRRKGKSKNAKVEKTKKDAEEVKDVVPSVSATADSMFGLYFVHLFVINANLLIQSGKLKKAQDVISAGMDTVDDAKKVYGAVPPSWLHVIAKLYYLKGLVFLLGCKGSDGNVLETVWGFFSTAAHVGDSHNSEGVSHGGDSYNSERDSHGSKASEKVQERTRDDDEKEAVETKPRRKRGRPANVAKSRPVTARRTGNTKGRGRSKKVECNMHVSDEDKSSLVETDAVDKQRLGTIKEKAKDITDSNDKGAELQLAIQCFRKAFDLCQSRPEPKLFSRICHCLSLCYGKANTSNAVHCLNLSLAVTLRYEAINSSRKKIKKLMKNLFPEEPSLTQDIETLAKKLQSVSLADEPTTKSLSGYERLLKIRNSMRFQSHVDQPNPATGLPKDWTVCTLVSVTLPGGFHELIVSRLREGRDPVILKLPISNDGDGHSDDAHSSGAVNRAVMDLSKLFQGSTGEDFTDIMKESMESMTISDSKEWFEQRSKLDDNLKNLIGRLENSWLGVWKGIVLGQNSRVEVEESLHQCARDLFRRLEVAIGRTVELPLIEVLLDSRMHLTKLQTKEALGMLTGLQMTSKLLNKVVEEFENVAGDLLLDGSKTSRKKSKRSVAKGRHPVILILGRDIQHLPWESIPILREHAVTRMPSLQFALSQIQQGEVKHEAYTVDPLNTYYVLNPESNLPHTQKVFQKWFEGEDQWHGVTGTKPSEGQYRSALVDHDLFIYLGHGNGRSFLTGDDVQRLNCRATTVLMGCSSGKLIVGGDCEPRGMSLNYLLAGCPAIVANLWDVTDKDIDRFTQTLLEGWLESGEQYSLAQFVNKARNACRLPYLIGASPVVYGIPVYLKR